MALFSALRAQPAIDALTARLQARHNVDGRVIVYATVQVPILP